MESVESGSHLIMGLVLRPSPDSFQRQPLSGKIDRDQEFREGSVANRPVLAGKEFPAVKTRLALEPVLGADLNLCTGCFRSVSGMTVRETGEEFSGRRIWRSPDVCP